MEEQSSARTWQRRITDRVRVNLAEGAQQRAVLLLLSPHLHLLERLGDGHISSYPCGLRRMLPLTE